jgi:hypothetical protein
MPNARIVGWLQWTFVSTGKEAASIGFESDLAALRLKAQSAGRPVRGAVEDCSSRKQLYGKAIFALANIAEQLSPPLLIFATGHTSIINATG